jgi:hemerythrin superfamily protein
MEKSSKASSSKTRSSNKAMPTDAIALLKADHRQVAEWFGEYEDAESAAKKQKLADQICKALHIHTTVEEEIFYPAFIKATGDEDMHHEAIVEHDGARKLIAEIEASTPEDEYFDAKIKVLSELIKHHVKEEEQPRGMFAEARKSEMDLVELGAELFAAKNELQSEFRKRTPG